MLIDLDAAHMRCIDINCYHGDCSSEYQVTRVLHIKRAEKAEKAHI